MKTRRFFGLLPVMAALLLCTACSSEIEELTAQPKVKKTIPYSVTVNQADETRATLNSSSQYVFEEGDKLYVEDEDGNTYGVLTLNSSDAGKRNDATFEGDLIYDGDGTPDASTLLTATLVSTSDKVWTISPRTNKLINYAYTGAIAATTAEAVQKYSMFVGFSTYGSGSFTLDQWSTFISFTITINSGVSAGTPLDVKISNGGSTELIGYTTTVTEDSKVKARFVAAFIGDYTTLSNASVKLGDTDIPFGGSTTLAANKIYTVTKSVESVSVPVSTTSDPLTLEAIAEGTITITNPKALTIEYSKDKSNWTSSSANSITIDVEAGDKVYFRGDNAAYGGGTKISCSSNCYVYGNIMSLINKDTYPTLTELTEAYTFANLFDGDNDDIYFRGDTHIWSSASKKLILPATTLADNCYRYMFCYCRSLTSAPDLPATILAEDCYSGMFSHCTNLTSAPDISATTLAGYCYYNMFGGCESLTSAPELPVKTLAEECYGYMFSGCTSLTTAPDLPATTLAEDCYRGMFQNCTSLTSAPDLPATTLADYCYYEMFSGCTSLTSAPDLPATTLADQCYYDMFSGCTSLTSVPALPATTLAGHCYFRMFQNCTSLTSAPALPATTLVGYCYCQMFYGCESLMIAPDLPAKTLEQGCYSNMFYGCTNLGYVKCLATNISATYCTSNWLSGVKSTGSFVKATGMTNWTTGSSGIPSGWTVTEE